MESKCFVLLLFSTCLLIPGRAHPGCRICFRQADDNSQYQGISESCSGYSRPKSPEWSSPFRDDTGGKSERHTYQWRVEAGDQILNFLQSIASAFRRQEEAISAMEHEPRAPVGAASWAGLSLSMIILMQAQVTVVIHE